MGKYKTGKIVFYFLTYYLISLTQISVAGVYTLNKKSEIKSITEAINKANPNDTIIVIGGIYKEKNIIIKKPLVLTGINRPVIDGENKYELFSVFASDVLIEGFELRNGGTSNMNDLAGIKVYNSKNVVIKNNNFFNMFFGIYFQECTNSKALNNIIKSSGNSEINSGNGIHCWKSTELSIINNKISGQRDGIYFEFVTHSTIENNISENNIRYGLHFMFSHDDRYLNNIFRFNGAGVAVMYTHHVIMINNTFSDNWGSASYGLLMKDISDSDVMYNRFTGNTVAIYMEGSNRNKILSNVLSGNGSALKIQASCDDNTIEKNNFLSNTFDVTTNGSLIQNKFRANYWDKYEGYDLNRDKTGDIPYHPISLYSMIIEQMPVATIFLRSFLVALLDKTEKAIPSITPDNFRDEEPKLVPYIL